MKKLALLFGDIILLYTGLALALFLRNKELNNEE